MDQQIQQMEQHIHYLKTQIPNTQGITGTTNPMLAPLQNHLTVIEQQLAATQSWIASTEAYVETLREESSLQLSLQAK